jgi:hypothetical protein
MLLPVLVAVIVVVVAIVVLVAARSWMRERGRKEAVLQSPTSETLEYLVPEGQDPAQLIGALRMDGYTAVVDAMGIRQRLSIDCPNGVERDRPHVRAIIKNNSATAIEHGAELDLDRVVFEDER